MATSGLTSACQRQLRGAASLVHGTAMFIYRAGLRGDCAATNPAQLGGLWKNYCCSVPVRENRLHKAVWLVGGWANCAIRYRHRSSLRTMEYAPKRASRRFLCRQMMAFYLPRASFLIAVRCQSLPPQASKPSFLFAHPGFQHFRGRMSKRIGRHGGWADPMEVVVSRFQWQSDAACHGRNPEGSRNVCVRSRRHLCTSQDDVHFSKC